MTDEEMLSIVRGSLTRTRDALADVHMQPPAAVLVARARARQRRRWLSASAAVSAALAAALVLVMAGPGSGRGAPSVGVPQASTVAYTLNRVKNAVANGNRVLYEKMIGGPWEGTFGWVYGVQGQFEEYWPHADYRDRVVNGQDLWDFPLKDRGKLFLAQGTIRIRGKLKSAYVTYWDHRYSLSGLAAPPLSACSKDVALSMGGPPIPGIRWSAFIDATLACGAASVTGHVRINGVETTKITGKPVTVRMVPGQARAVSEKYARAAWILYVNSRTYLPVRMYSALTTFGGPRPSTMSSGTADISWLPPTPANIARTLVTIPPGFHRWHGNPGNQ
jgi:hypothetical protein